MTTLDIMYGIPFGNSEELHTWIQTHHKELSSFPFFPKELTLDDLSEMEPSYFAMEKYNSGVRLTKTLNISAWPAYVGYAVYSASSDDPHIGLDCDVRGVISIPKQIRHLVDEAFQQIGCPRHPQIYSVCGHSDGGTSYRAHGTPQEMLATFLYENKQWAQVQHVLANDLPMHNRSNVEIMLAKAYLHTTSYQEALAILDRGNAQAYTTLCYRFICCVSLQKEEKHNALLVHLKELSKENKGTTPKEFFTEIFSFLDGLSSSVNAQLRSFIEILLEFAHQSQAEFLAWLKENGKPFAEMAEEYGYSESERTEFIADYPSILCHKATDTWYEESTYDYDKSEYIYAPSSYDSVIAKLEQLRA